MTKHEFLQRLEAGLATVPAEERVAALQYYTEYFDDAGPEHEAEVIAEVGSPEQLAADIRAESGAAEPTLPMAAPMAPAGQDDAFRQGQQAAQNMMRRTQFTGGEGTYVPRQQPPIAQSLGNIARVVLLVAAILLSPALFGVFISLVVVCCVPFIVGFAFVFAGFALAISSTLLFAVTPGSGFVVLGTGFVMAGGGLLALFGGVMLFTKAIPAVVRGIRGIWAALFRKEVSHNG